MQVHETTLPGVLLIEPEMHADPRGHFLETWHDKRYDFAGPFVQDNLSYSRRHVLRGLHRQWPSGQGKLVYVPQGEVFDVVVDLKTKQWIGHTLSAQNGHQLWIPPGFAHGFLVTGDGALLAYKCTAPYAPEHERTVRWDDPALAIDWPLDGAEPVLSPRDAAAPALDDIDTALLP